jgi:hypothetical protein
MLLATMLQGVVHQDADGKIVWMNAAAERILGRTSEELLGETSMSVAHHTIHEDGTPFPGLEHPAMVALRTGQDVQGVTMGVYNPREMAYRWLNVSAIPVRRPGASRPDHVYSLFDDITDRKRAEEAVRKSEERLRLALSAGAMATWDWHVPTGDVTWNDEHFRMLGYEPGEVAPSYRAWAERIHPEDRAATEGLVRASVEQGTDYRAEFRSLTPDGTVRWIEARGRTERDVTGQPLRQYGVMLDITDRKRTEEALRDSERRLRELSQRLSYHVDNSPLAVIEWGPDMRLTRWSNAAERMFGWRADEVLGKRMQDFRWIHVEDSSQVADVASDLQGGTDPRRFSANRNYRKDGSIIDCEWHNSSLLDESGHLRSILSFVLDVTERKRAEDALRQSERLYRGIGESIDYGIWVCAPDGRNTYASESFLKLVGITQEQCSNFGWGDVLHPDDAERTIAAWQECVRTGGTWDIEHRMRGVDGRWHPILARGVPVKDERGEIVCWAGINLDVSQLKQAEADLRDREAALREADAQKNRFLAVLSHELRNPLTPITNSLYILDRAAPGSEQANRAKAVIARQVSHLTRIVDDLLDVTRIVSGKLRLQCARFDLAQLLRRTAEDHRTEFVDAGVTLDVRVGPEPVWMVGDESRMAQATGNLLGNSTKFTASGGRVVLTLEVDPAAAMGVIRVRDTGVGIHAELLQKIFEPFVQADSSLDRSKSGLGLGLALVKSVADLHGGTVTARSDGPGQGAEFVIRVPVESQEVLAPASDRPALDRSRPRRILVIEDSRDAADSLRIMLEFGHHQVEVAYDGPDGIEKAKAFGPDVVFCDIGLPGMNGYEVARTFRSDQALRSTCLVALSGYAQPEDQQKAAEAGFDGHVAKPASVEKLQEVMSALSGTARARPAG